MTHGPGERITANQPPVQTFRQGLDHAHLHGYAGVLHQTGQGPRLFQQGLGVHRQQGDHRAQHGSWRLFAQTLHRRAGDAHQIQRQIDTVQGQIILAAVLKVIDHLQGGAQGVGGRPGGAILAVHVQNESPHRRGRIAAIIHQIGPVFIAGLGHVAAKGFHEIEGVGAAQAERGLDLAQGDRLGDGVGLASQGRIDGGQPRELLRRRRGWMIGDVIGHARHAVEGHHHGAVARRDEEGGDGKILIPMALAGRQIVARAHAAMAWDRPFHWPPRPRQTSSAERIVKAV